MKQAARVKERGGMAAGRGPHAGGGSQPAFACRRDVTLPGLTILRVEGDIDVSSAPALERDLTAALERGVPVILEMEGVRYIDATIYHMLRRVRQGSAGRPPRLVLAGLSGPIRETASRLGLRRVAEIEDSVDDAKRSLAAR